MSRKSPVVDRVASGIFAKGVVLARWRRQVGEPARTVITYRIFAGDSSVDIEDWTEGVPFEIDQEVELDVRARAFVTKQGRALVQYERVGGQKGAF